MSTLETILEILACVILFSSIIFVFGYVCYWCVISPPSTSQELFRGLDSVILPQATNQTRVNEYVLDTILPMYDFSSLSLPPPRGDTFIPYYMHRFPTPPIK
jgi:hypothetical protein